MSNTESPPADLSDEQVVELLKGKSKFKQRSHDTHHTVHIPELQFRLGLTSGKSPPINDTSTAQPNLSNTSPITTVYIGNSMLERLKNTGSSTRTANLHASFNAGVGGDKTVNMLDRLHQSLYTILKNNTNIKTWVLASGTNDIHPKKGLVESDAQAYRILLQALLNIAPESRVLACDVFYRKDIDDGVVERANEVLEEVVRSFNEERSGGQRVLWVKTRHLVTKDMLVDHVHLDEKGYEVWDGVLWDALQQADPTLRVPKHEP